jgi:hypothetical protein
VNITTPVFTTCSGLGKKISGKTPIAKTAHQIARRPSTELAIHTAWAPGESGFRKDVERGVATRSAPVREGRPELVGEAETSWADFINDREVRTLMARVSWPE